MDEKNNKQIYYPNGYYINKTDVFIFDIFYKNKKIYLLLPVVCVETIIIDNIFFIVDGKQIKPSDVLQKKQTKEPINLLIYEYYSDNSNLDVKIIYNEININYTLDNINNSSDEICKLSVTTLLKNDYKYFETFYTYYKEQGVSCFYIYYNGVITSEISAYFNYNDVTLIEWNYEYWNKHFLSGASHVAQLGQMHHALYKYGKGLSEYMIFCDLDEYMYIPNYRLRDYIKINPTCDIFGFCNRWSDTSDNNIPKIIPPIIYTQDRIKYKNRSKNIYKTSAVELLNIHYPFKCNKDCVYITDFDMFHFYKWSGKKRVFPTTDVFILQNKQI